MKMFLSTAINGAVIGIWAALFAAILTGPGEVFGWVPKLYRRVVRSAEPLQGWRYLLSKPLYACAVCHAGQVSLWGFFLLYPGRWQFFDHFTFVVVAMFTAAVITRAWS